VLADTNKAREAIAQRNQTMANQCISDALSTIDRIQGMSGQTGSSANLVPIYTEMGQVSVIGPVYTEQQRHSASPTSNQSAMSKQNTDKYQSSQQNNTSTNTYSSNTPRNGATAQTQTRGEASRESTDQASAQRTGQPAVQEVAQEFTSITLDTNMAKQHLKAASTAMQNGNYQQADTALSAVQDGVSLVSVEGDRPLVRARENLTLARDMAQQGQYQKVGAPLRAAADALQNYESMNTAHASDARSLRQQIRSYANNLNSSNMNTSSSSNSDAVKKIDSWWNTTNDWTTSSTSSTSSH